MTASGQAATPKNVSKEKAKVIVTPERKFVNDV